MSIPTTTTTPTGVVATHEYKIVTGFTPSRLEEAVQQHMSTGWQLAGGVQHFDTLNEAWAQSMYRIQSNAQLLQS